jgi:hypothetical protein
LASVPWQQSAWRLPSVALLCSPKPNSKLGFKSSQITSGECSFTPKYRLKKLLGAGAFGAMFLADEVIGDRICQSSCD